MIKISDRTRFIVIIICFLIGSAIIIADLMYSESDDVRYRYNEPTDYSENWIVSYRGTTINGNALTPKELDIEANEVVTIKKTLPDVIDSHTELFFRASHTRVKVFIDDNQVYSFGHNTRQLFSKTPFSAWLTIPLDSSMAGKEITIEYTKPDGVNKVFFNAIYLGSGNAAALFNILPKIPNLLLCFVLIILCIPLLLIRIILHKYDITKSLFCLGLLSLIIGTWGLFGTKTLQLFIGSATHTLNIEFLLFNLISPTVMWFFLSLDIYKKKKTLHMIFWMSIAIFLLIEALALLKVAGYMETMSVTHAYIFTFTIYVVIVTIIDIVKSKEQKKRLIPLFAVCEFLVLSLCDLIHLYLPHAAYSDESYFTKIGLLFFVTLWTIELLFEFSRVMMRAAKADVLKKLAYEDYMTGLRNRTAFEEDLKKYEEALPQNNISIVLFDMNDLKYVNDVFGHTQGDIALSRTASIILEEFSDYGFCYRIGGDEMCVLAETTDLEQIADITSKIMKRISDYNAEVSLDFSVAFGIAVTNFAAGKGTGETFDEADRAMYKCKRLMKS